MGTSRLATSVAGPLTQPPLVDLLVRLLATNIRSIVKIGVVCPHRLHLRRKVPTLPCLNRGPSSQRQPGSPNRLRHLMGIRLAVGLSSRRMITIFTTHVLGLMTIRV